MSSSLVRRSGLLVALLLLVSSLGIASPAGAAEEQVKIIRDQFGVPHVYAETSAGVSYGAGYALAQDRLWQMHVLRRLAKGRLAEIVPLEQIVALDKEARFMTYTEAERAARFKTYPQDIQTNLQAFADGINAWLATARTNPSLMPHEFMKFGETPEDWVVDDSLALQDYLVLSFGSGGGNEIVYADLLSDMLEKFGKKKGRAAWNDLVLKHDPDTVVSIPRSYKYKKKTTAARVSEAQSRRGLENDARISLSDGGARRGQRLPDTDAAKGTLDQLSLIPDTDAVMKDFLEHQKASRWLDRHIRFGSNAQIAGPKLSASGNSLQTGGPQVGYYLPQILADFGMHGGGIDATGMTFAGAGPAILIGRGPGYAWTTTTGSSDLTDTFVEKLNPDDPRQYRFKGKWEDMECRTETYRMDAAPAEEQEICRTRHGPVVSFDEANNVAYSIRYSWFNREGQTIEGFWRYNEVESLEDFATASNYLSSNHNMFYSDDQGNYGYWHPGNHVVRAKGVDIRLPQDGTGGSEWRGLLPIKKVPHEVNGPRGWLANWNNQPAANWPREKGHPALDNAIDLQTALDPAGPEQLDPYTGEPYNTSEPYDFEDMSGNLRYAAYRHHLFTYFEKYIPKAKSLEGDIPKAAASLLREWDGFLVAQGENPTDKDGMYHAGKTIVDAWVAKMREMAFMDDLGEEHFGRGDTSLLWHLLEKKDRLDLRFDWLGKTSVKELKAKAFEEAIAALVEDTESQNPEEWQQPVARQHYQRLNAELVEDTAECEAGDCSNDSGRPGDVPDHILMDRGTYNHVIEYLGAPSGQGLGNSPVNAGSVIPPGQSGFINPVGVEAPHFEDQLSLYVDWKYKPMPITLEEALAVKETEETITYSSAP
ncbi:MAG TPA: penicillin acylase family protein [Actinomycetota bacterium]|nr:penicillin acylase family protein [Actinomycetota bacterium]